MLSECRRLWNNFDPMVVRCLVYIGQQTDRPVRLIDNDNMHLYDVQRVQIVTSQCLYNNIVVHQEQEPAWPIHAVSLLPTTRA